MVQILRGIIYLTNEAQSETLEDAVTGQCEFVLVPRVPTEEMLEAASDYALDEDAGGVWKAMIEEYERDTKHRVVGIRGLLMGCSLSSGIPKTCS